MVNFAVMRLAKGGGIEEVDGTEREAGRVSEGITEEVMVLAEGDPIEQLREMS